MKLKQTCRISFRVVVLFIVCLFMLLGCRNDETKTITLSFDKNIAYFSSSVLLFPIAGELPINGEVHEEATIILKSSSAAILRLAIEFEDDISEIEGMCISINDIVHPMSESEILFESSETTTTETLSVKIFLAHNAPVTIAGQLVEFYFILYVI